MKLNIENLISISESGMPIAPNLRQLLDRDVLALYSRDSTPDKRKYIGDCGVIYYLGDPKSPVRQKGLSDEECLKEAIENFNLPESYKPDALVYKLIQKYYKEHITTAGVAIENLNRALHIADLAANKILEILNKKLRSDISDEDIPIIMANIDAVSKRIKDMPELSKALSTAYDNLKDEEENRIARGGVSILSSMDADEG